MNPELIILSEYCSRSNIEPSFIHLLEEEGLIHISRIEGESYLYTSELGHLERYTRLYYELSINPEGIDAIRHLLIKIQELKEENKQLYTRLRLYENRFDETEEHFL